MWCRRNPLVAILTSVVAILLVAVSVGATVSAAWLRSERNQALTNLGRAQTAEKTATESTSRERETRLRG